MNFYIFQRRLRAELFGRLNGLSGAFAREACGTKITIVCGITKKFKIQNPKFGFIPPVSLPLRHVR
ncbi:MAG: hypothetical protein J1D86_00310 [Alistipes sp.]|nr:hypothetical protein [Alistipes sp.]